MIHEETKYFEKFPARNYELKISFTLSHGQEGFQRGLKCTLVFDSQRNCGSMV